MSSILDKGILHSFRKKKYYLQYSLNCIAKKAPYSFFFKGLHSYNSISFPMYYRFTRLSAYFCSNAAYAVFVFEFLVRIERKRRRDIGYHGGAAQFCRRTPKVAFYAAEMCSGPILMRNGRGEPLLHRSYNGVA